MDKVDWSQVATKLNDELERVNETLTRRNEQFRKYVIESQTLWRISGGRYEY